MLRRKPDFAFDLACVDRIAPIMARPMSLMQVEIADSSSRTWIVTGNSGAAHKPGVASSEIPTVVKLTNASAADLCSYRSESR